MILLFYKSVAVKHNTDDTMLGFPSKNQCHTVQLLTNLWKELYIISLGILWLCCSNFILIGCYFTFENSYILHLWKGKSVIGLNFSSHLYSCRTDICISYPNLTSIELFSVLPNLTSVGLISALSILHCYTTYFLITQCSTVSDFHDLTIYTFLITHCSTVSDFHDLLH